MRGSWTCRGSELGYKHCHLLPQFSWQLIDQQIKAYLSLIIFVVKNSLLLLRLFLGKDQRKLWNLRHFHAFATVKRISTAISDDPAIKVNQDCYLIRTGFNSSERWSKVNKNLKMLFTSIICLLVLSSSLASYGFNLDLESALIFSPPPGSESKYFGYSVALHSFRDKYW